MARKSNKAQSPSKTIKKKNLKQIKLYKGTTLEAQTKSLRSHIIRLWPGQDLLKSIEEYIAAKKLKAGWMVTCVGSLTHLSLRMAGQPIATKIHSKSTTWEILSLVGTLSRHKDSHLHLCVSDKTGKTIGGHVMEGNIVHTTAELVIQEPLDLKFHRV
jgi:uncharacterized protein